MVMALEFVKEYWVQEEDGRVMLFCEKCFSESPAVWHEETLSFLLECENCCDSRVVPLMKADFYQPTWP